MAGKTGWNFYTTAVPLSNVTGTKSYCAAHNGVVRQEPAGTINGGLVQIGHFHAEADDSFVTIL